MRSFAANGLGLGCEAFTATRKPSFVARGPVLVAVRSGGGSAAFFAAGAAFFLSDEGGVTTCGGGSAATAPLVSVRSGTERLARSRPVCAERVFLARFPEVTHVPVDFHDTGEAVLLSIEGALRDPTVWGADAHGFNLRRAKSRPTARQHERGVENQAWR